MGTLSQRYNEEFLNRAEERKEKLQYENNFPISFYYK